MQKIMTSVLLMLMGSTGYASEFCVSYWEQTFQFKESFGVYMAVNCDGHSLVSDKEVMRFGSNQEQRLIQQLSSKMSQIGYEPVAQFGIGYVLFEKGEQGLRDTCVIELFERYRPSLSCSNKNVNTQIHVDDLEIYKIYLTRLGYNFISKIAPQVGSSQKHFMIYQK